MTEVAVFHHVLGLTESVRRFAAALRDAGHTVHTPDLFEGRTFDTIANGARRGDRLPARDRRPRPRGGGVAAERPRVRGLLAWRAVGAVPRPDAAWRERRAALLLGPAARRVG